MTVVRYTCIRVACAIIVGFTLYNHSKLKSVWYVVDKNLFTSFVDYQHPFTFSVERESISVCKQLIVFANEACINHPRAVAVAESNTGCRFHAEVLTF